ncbi:MAG: hypothetical protein KC680_00865 [Candidatus Peregrinibacteria bacterium]|nr:hypothetical protein [Candidatus Peregrinibacteria bacterium]MCB9807806.1 hypothetical protein [Candidatus Peribacteria bacterium]
MNKKKLAKKKHKDIEDVIHQRIIDHIKQKTRQKKVKFKDMAQEIGIGRQHLSRLGKARPITPELLRKWMYKLNYKPDQIEHVADYVSTLAEHRHSRRVQDKDLGLLDLETECERIQIHESTGVIVSLWSDNKIGILILIDLKAKSIRYFHHPSHEWISFGCSAQSFNFNSAHPNASFIVAVHSAIGMQLKIAELDHLERTDMGMAANDRQLAFEIENDLSVYVDAFLLFYEQVCQKG